MGWVGGGWWVGRANAKRENGKEKWGGGGGDKIVDKQCSSCNAVDGYSRV